MNSQEVTTPLIKQKLTRKQRKFLKVYSETLNATEAAMQSYDCKDRNIAKSIGAQNLSKLNFQELMDVMGITDEKLVAVGIEGLTKSIRIASVNGKTQAVPDHATRHKYWDSFLKMRGKLDNSQKLELSGPGGEPLQIQMVAGIGFLNKPKDGDIK